jgi:hypothetical protein
LGIAGVDRRTVSNIKFDVLTAVLMNRSIILRDIAPCNPVLVSCLAYYSTLKMRAVCSSEISVDFYCTTWRYITEDKIL